MSIRLATIQVGIAGKFGTWRGAGGGARSDSVVISVALQEVVLVPAAHEIGAPSAADPFMNCTVPVGGVVVPVTVAVSVTFPPEEIDVGLAVSAVVVDGLPVTVTTTGTDGP